MALESVGNVVDSMLIDNHMKDDVNDLDQIVYGTLKEIETNLGLIKEAPLMVDSYDPVVRQHNDFLQAYQSMFEKEITDSLVGENKNLFEKDDFVPNSAKAPLLLRQQENFDF